MLRRWIRRLLATVGTLMMVLGLGYGGTIAYVSWREQVSPSTQQMLKLKDGQQIPLVQPTTAPIAPKIAPGATAAEATAAPELVIIPAQLPPMRVAIPSIGVDWPVVLSDNDNLPQFRGVGWLMGSGFPGAPGNIVLFGHLGGPHGTFMRLNELKPGDEFSIFTTGEEHRYKVRATHETTLDDVSVLAPTSDASATLITCSGPWDAVAQTNVRRLIVQADYEGH